MENCVNHFDHLYIHKHIYTPNIQGHAEDVHRIWDYNCRTINVCEHGMGTLLHMIPRWGKFHVTIYKECKIVCIVYIYIK